MPLSCRRVALACKSARAALLSMRLLVTSSLEGLVHFAIGMTTWISSLRSWNVKEPLLRLRPSSVAAASVVRALDERFRRVLQCKRPCNVAQMKSTCGKNVANSLLLGRIRANVGRASSNSGPHTCSFFRRFPPANLVAAASLAAVALASALAFASLSNTHSSSRLWISEQKASPDLPALLCP